MKKKLACVTLLMLNNNYLPGALMLGMSLRKYSTKADLICLITEEISQEAQGSLLLIFDSVILVDKIRTKHKRD